MPIVFLRRIFFFVHNTLVVSTNFSQKKRSQVWIVVMSENDDVDDFLLALNYCFGVCTSIVIFCFYLISWFRNSNIN